MGIGMEGKFGRLWCRLRSVEVDMELFFVS
jgi:hypothetical protein